jgi:Trypsin-like peptidase domain
MHVNANVLTRVFQIKAGGKFGTAFTIEVHERLYLVTAKQVVEELPEMSARVLVTRQATHKELIVNVLRPNEPATDVAVLTSAEYISPTLPLEPTMDGIQIGQDVYFLGFAFGISYLVSSEGYPFPLVKQGTLSAADFGGPTKIIHVDGFNNPGFSGGPIIFNAQGSNDLKVAGVVGAYRLQEEKVRYVSQYQTRETDLAVMTNSGILVGYSIDHALNLIATRPESRSGEAGKHVQARSTARQQQRHDEPYVKAFLLTDARHYVASAEPSRSRYSVSS